MHNLQPHQAAYYSHLPVAQARFRAARKYYFLDILASHEICRRVPTTHAEKQIAYRLAGERAANAVKFKRFPPA